MLTSNAARINTICKLSFTVLMITALLAPAPAPAKADPALPPGFTIETVVKNLNSPVAVTWSPDGRMFIALKAGQVKVVYNGALLPTNFIDLSAQVNDFWDRGLLGIAIHPDFPAAPYVYLLYTYDPPGTTPDSKAERVARLIRVSANPDNLNVALPGSEVVLLGANSTLENIGDPNLEDGTNADGVTPGPASCEVNGAPVQDCLPADTHEHTIGTVAFGIDGSLFIGNGEGSNSLYLDPRALRAQNLDSLAGKILRIDPTTGNGLPDNPFYDGDPTHNRSKVWSYGLRNPYRFAIHPETNEPFIGDVGWGVWEEVNTGRGSNFGWPCYEGDNNGSAIQLLFQADPRTEAACAALYAQGSGAVQAPLYAYFHIGGGLGVGASVQVGEFYTGTIYPAEYQGALFIEDYNEDWIKYLTFDRRGNATVHDFASDLSPPGSGPVHLTVGPDSNLYYVTYTTKTAEVRRIRYTAGGNHSPIVRTTAAPTVGGTPLKVSFSSGGTIDPDADKLTYQWAFGDGETSTEASPTHTYNAAGAYTAVLTVADPNGGASTSEIVIVVGNNAPAALIETPANGAQYTVGDTIRFNGQGDDFEDGALPDSGLQWSVLVHHNDQVQSDYFSATGASGSFVAPDHSGNYWLELCLSAVDSVGGQGAKCIELRPATVRYTFESKPSGLKLVVDDVAYTTPFSVDIAVNSKLVVLAPAGQQHFTYVFDGWSNDGSRRQTVNVGNAPQAFSAAYAFIEGLGDDWRER